MPILVPALLVCRIRSPVDPPPRPHQALDMGRRRRAGEAEELGFVRGGCHAGQRTHLRVGELAALHGGAQAREGGQGAGDAHLLARGPQIESGAPVEPVAARVEALVPPLALVELADQDQQLVGGGLDAGRQLGDGVTEAVHLGALAGLRRGCGNGCRCHGTMFGGRHGTIITPCFSAA